MDYASNFSPRYKIRYRHGGQQHVMGFRLPRGAARDDEATTSKVAALLTAMGTLIFTDFAAINAVYIPQDSFVSVPVALGDLGTFSGVTDSGNITPTQKGLQMRLECRGNTGGHTAFVLFGTAITGFATGANNDWRIYASEDARVAALVAAMSGLAPEWVPLGSTEAVWGNYVNVKVNDYWLNNGIRQ
jgi:hypothetical protein